MPTGYPNDPFAHAEKMRAKNAELLRIDEERVANGGPLKLKRAYKKRTEAASSAPTPINIGIGIEEDHAYTEKKNPLKRVHKKRTHKPRKTAETKTSTRLIQDLRMENEKLHDEAKMSKSLVDSQNKDIKALEKDLAELLVQHDAVGAVVDGYQERAETAARHMFAVLSLVENQK